METTQKTVLMVTLGFIFFASNSHSSEDHLKCCSVEVLDSSVRVNCSSLSWTSVDGRCLPASTEILLLDNNNLTTLTNGTFGGLFSLRCLSISSSNVRYIQSDAFLGLNNLQSLNLQNNLLHNEIGSFSPEIFRHFTNLRELNLAENNIQLNTRTSELDVIFSYLSHLTTISLDGSETLTIGMEFRKLTQLSNLTLYCYNVRRITNTSFIGLWNSTVKELSLLHFNNMNFEPNDMDVDREQRKFSDDAFQNLRSLQILRINECRIGNQNMARKLKHFVNSSLHTLHLKTTHYRRTFYSPNVTFEDGALIKETAKYLSRIKLDVFSWIDSSIIAIAPRVIGNSSWRHHIRKVDLSKNNLGFLGWRAPLFESSQLTKLQELIVASTSASDDQIYRKLRHIDDNSDVIMKRIDDNSDVTIKHIDDNNDVIKLQPDGNLEEPTEEKSQATTNDYPTNDYPTNDYPANGHLTETKQWEEDNVASRAQRKSNKRHASLNSQVRLTKGISPAFPGDSGNWTFRLPASLRVLRMVSLLQDETNLSKQILKFVQSSSGCVNLTHIYFIANGIFRGTGRVMGFTNLQLLDLSENGLIVENYFFDDFPKLRYLILQSIRNEDFFQRIQIDRLIQNLPELRYLDLTNNKLNFLPRNLFVRNPHITHVILSKNRFSSIPLTISLVPNLKVLDVSGNAISYLDDQEMNSLTSQREKVPDLYVALAENNLACVCSQLKFLSWLNVSDFVDNKGNYSCTSEEGQLTSTGVLVNDLMGYYRECNDFFYFMMSVVLLLLLSFALMTVYALHRFRNALEAFLVRMFVKAFRPMKSTDYKYHVYIGYADDDYDFVRHKLRVFLEQKLRVSTYIHQRDLHQGYVDHQMFEAIANSWRILLVITGQFLNNYDMSDIVMKYASHSVTPANQNRVVVLVHDKHRHNIPGYLYDILDDSRIIVFSSLTGDLDYEHKEKIKQSLRDLS